MAQTTLATKLKVLVSFSILADLVKVVGGDAVEVSSLVGANEDAHVFEPKPSHAKTLLGSQLLVVNGLDFEPWMTKLVRSASYKGKTVVASQGVKPLTMQEDGHTETDPHAWQNPLNVILYVNNIAQALASVDPAHAADYQARAQAYVQQLQELDSWAQSMFKEVPKAQRKIITSHDAFGYFAQHYQIQFLAAQGLNTESEPSARQIAKLVQQMRREKVRTVFLENMSNPRLITQLSKEAGAQVGATLYADALSAPDQPGATYLGMMRHNIDKLAQSLKP
ncbi:metal ABC transporter substrate-binding protein [Curvibacter sp. CHRR-16]|nr:metal ABC transporter substrate-binding protein [Curvibacter sp. CHRR-16]